MFDVDLISDLVADLVVDLVFDLVFDLVLGHSFSTTGFYLTYFSPEPDVFFRSEKLGLTYCLGRT